MTKTMGENRSKSYYSLWSIIGVAVILFGVFLTTKKPGTGVLIELLIALVAFKISLQETKTGFLIIGAVFLIELLTYTIYCATGSASVCQRNLFVVSASSPFLFGAIWLASFICLAILKIFKPGD
jgi:hypothetical protein